MKKRGPGRPSLGKRARTIRVSVKVTPVEKALWLQKARKAHQPFGVWILAPRRQEFPARY
jgi:hypothetical protein